MSALGEDIAQLIRQEGPISVERYMALALSHPQHGYYMSREPFGTAGDFTTAPEISQMFGELIGLWAAQAWEILGAPAPVLLVELGPGRGTLMQDALRAARVAQHFHASLDVHLVETSPRLEAAQRERLARGVPATWHRSIDTVPDGPAIVIANELFDALPARQYFRARGGWRERCVGLGGDGGLTFGLAPAPEPGIGVEAAEGAILEVAVAGHLLMRALAARIASQGGALLVLDYGHVHTGVGDTLQALRGHRFADVLEAPGMSDLTTHVDFAALARAAQGQGLAVQGPVAQGIFLMRLGIAERAQALARNAGDGQRADIASALARLTQGGANMGELFKAMAVCSPATPPLPGFFA